MMVFDVDKLKEALDSWSIDPAIPGDGLNHKQRMRIAVAVRLVVAGQPLWWCEVHNEKAEPSSYVDQHCCPGGEWDEEAGRYDCMAVEGWWMPTGTSE